MLTVKASRYTQRKETIKKSYTYEVQSTFSLYLVDNINQAFELMLSVQCQK